MDFTIRLLIGLGTVLIVSGIGCGIVYLKKRKRRRQIKNWRRAGCYGKAELEKAEVLRYGDRRKRGKARIDHFKVIYRYEAAGKKYNKILYFFGDFPSEELIYYDPEAPEKSFTDGEMWGDKKDRHGYWISMGAGITAALLIWGLLLV